MFDAEDTFSKQEIQAGYVTSGRDVLAHQKHLVAQSLSEGSGAARVVTRRKVGGGGPSGTGRASTNPIFPPPCYDEPLQLQAQMGHPTDLPRTTTNAVCGVRLGGAASPGGTLSAGGIGSAIQNAARVRPNQMQSQQQALVSSARLDSFTLLKVIGKGLYG